MNLLNLFMGTLGSDDSINSLAKKTGVNASLMTKLLPLAIPILLKALTKNAGKEGGAASLLTALGQHKSTRSIPQQIDEVDEEDGQKIVAHILGDDSDKVVSALAQETGMEGGQVSRSLGALAPALMSMLSNSANTVHSSGHAWVPSGRRCSPAAILGRPARFPSGRRRPPAAVFRRSSRRSSGRRCSPAATAVFRRSSRCSSGRRWSTAAVFRRSSRLSPGRRCFSAAGKSPRRSDGIHVRRSVCTGR